VETFSTALGSTRISSPTALITLELLKPWQEWLANPQCIQQLERETSLGINNPSQVTISQRETSEIMNLMNSCRKWKRCKGFRLKWSIRWLNKTKQCLIKYRGKVGSRLLLRLPMLCILHPQFTFLDSQESRTWI